MISEDYVSFETAKLLKEKGFRAVTNRYYNAQFNQVRTVSDTFAMDWNDEEYMRSITMPGAVAIPTLQMAMKWLREMHDIHVVPRKDFFNGSYTGMIYDGRRENVFDKDDYVALVGYETYEKACEAGITYCLENLI